MERNYAENKAEISRPAPADLSLNLQNLIDVWAKIKQAQKH